MSSKRGRKRNDNLPPNRARDVQRAFRARRAAHLDVRTFTCSISNSHISTSLSLSILFSLGPRATRFRIGGRKWQPPCRLEPPPRKQTASGQRPHRQGQAKTTGGTLLSSVPGWHSRRRQQSRLLRRLPYVHQGAISLPIHHHCHHAPVPDRSQP
ncbi:hypothetical protein BJV74DRAFT_851965 [Russula compacta]|nr:hypothetical protein BJV74DRAFT_851965 [Russula compacta]